MTVLRVAAVQASYVLMDRDATIDRVAALIASAAREGAQLVVLPEVFVSGTPLWIDTQPIWDGDEEWFGLLAQNAVVIGDPASDRLAAIAAEHGGRSTTRCCTSPRTEKWPAGTGNSCPRAPNGLCGAWATDPRSPWWTPAGPGSAA
jgi:hypothetical protein